MQGEEDCNGEELHLAGVLEEAAGNVLNVYGEGGEKLRCEIE